MRRSVGKAFAETGGYMEELLALGMAVALVTATILIHYEILRATSARIIHIHIPARTRILVVLGAAFLSHFLQIALYALAYWLFHDRLGIGTIAGSASLVFFDYFYFSVSAYSTLGIGDLYPVGPLRLVAGIESLNGLILVGWTTSFTYLTMEKFWKLQRVVPRGAVTRVEAPAAVRENSTPAE